MTVELSNSDYNNLVRIVRAQPAFGTYQKRFNLLNTALAGSERRNDILFSMDLEGDPEQVATSVIYRLSIFGQVVPGKEALGIFLNQLLTTMSDADTNAQTIRALYQKYPLDVPASPNPPMTRWKGDESPVEVNEKIIGENTLRHVNRLMWALRASRPVVHLRVANQWFGTGFMVASDLLMTNNHVIQTAAQALVTEFTFNYQLDENEQFTTGQPAHPLNAGIFHTNANLDYTIVQLHDLPDFGAPLPLKSIVVARDDRVTIIQHPGGHLKQISMQNNFVAYADANVVQYTTSTLPGSSGSPVFDDRFDVVAIHHSGGELTEPSTGRHYLRNEGISMKAILDDLRRNAPELYSRVRKV